MRQVDSPALSIELPSPCSLKQTIYTVSTLNPEHCIHNLAPPYLCNKFRKRSNLHECCTRNRKLLLIPMYNTTTAVREHPITRGAKLCNDWTITLIPSLK